MQKRVALTVKIFRKIFRFENREEEIKQTNSRFCSQFFALYLQEECL
jgi:hypothetical protein